MSVPDEMEADNSGRLGRIIKISFDRIPYHGAQFLKGIALRADAEAQSGGAITAFLSGDGRKLKKVGGGAGLRPETIPRLISIRVPGRTVPTGKLSGCRRQAIGGPDGAEGVLNKSHTLVIPFRGVVAFHPESNGR